MKGLILCPVFLHIHTHTHKHAHTHTHTQYVQDTVLIFFAVIAQGSQGLCYSFAYSIKIRKKWYNSLRRLWRKLRKQKPENSKRYLTSYRSRVQSTKLARMNEIRHPLLSEHRVSNPSELEEGPMNPQGETRKDTFFTASMSSKSSSDEEEPILYREGEEGAGGQPPFPEKQVLATNSYLLLEDYENPNMYK